MTSIAYPLLVLYLTGSPLKAGCVACAAVAPRVVMYAPVGVFVDRWEPRRVMLLSEFSRGAVVTVIGVFWLIGRLGVTILAFCAVTEGILEAFSTLAERCYVRSLVEPDQAPFAQARLEARTHVVVLAGRPLGLFLFWLDPIAPFLFDALSFAISVIAIFRIEHKSFNWRSAGNKYREFKSIFETGWTSEVQLRLGMRDARRWLLREPCALSNIAISTGATLVAQALVIVALADAHVQRESPIVVGIMLAAPGAGGAVGAVLLTGPLRKLGRLQWVRIQAWVWLGALSIIAMAHSRSVVVVTAAVIGVLGLSGALGNIELNTYLVQAVSDGMLGRVTSIVRTLTFSACAAGSALGGLLAQDLPKHAIWVLFAITVILPVLSFTGSAHEARKPIPDSSAGRSAEPVLVVGGRHNLCDGNNDLRKIAAELINEPDDATSAVDRLADLAAFAGQHLSTRAEDEAEVKLRRALAVDGEIRHALARAVKRGCENFTGRQTADRLQDDRYPTDLDFDKLRLPPEGPMVAGCNSASRQ